MAGRKYSNQSGKRALPATVKSRATGKASDSKTRTLRINNATAKTAIKIENEMIDEFGPKGSSNITSNARDLANVVFRQGEKAARIKNNRKK